MMASKFPPKREDNSHIIPAKQKLEWSPYQKALFKEIAYGTGHVIVEARAGSAKTTSIVEGLKYAPKGKKIIILAFNKKIQEELQKKVSAMVETFTFHSLGYRAIRQRFGPVQLDEYKVIDILKSQLGKDVNFDLIDNLAQTVAFCKYGLLDSPKQIDYLIDSFGIDLCEMPRPEFISTVIKTLGINKKITNKIDFNDMCWLPFVYNLPLGKYDIVAVDERQDLNLSQLFMAKKVCNPNGGRIIAVGDELQTIYGWRMADTSVIEEIKKQETTKILPLPISYRCPKKVIELSKLWVPDITCPPTAIDGEVHEISLNSLFKEAKPGSFILSRTNAPLIKLCMGFIRNGVKANIRGRDVGKQLQYLVKKSKKKRIDAFLRWLEIWKDEEVARLKEKRINPENVLDRYECLVTLCEESSSVDEVIEKVDELFNDSDEHNIVILSTVHRTKGEERDDVFILRWTFRAWLEESVTLLEKPNEEANIAYVAATRAKKRLFIVKKI